MQCPRRRIDKDRVYCKPAIVPVDMPLVEKVKYPEFYQTRLVSERICQACPECENGFRFTEKQGEAVMQGRPRELPSGELVYPKRGWEPPPVPDGYRRKTSNLQSSDAWTMVPVLSDCKHRTKQVKYGSCGAAYFQYYCDLHAVEVTAKKCLRCEDADALL